MHILTDFGHGVSAQPVNQPVVAGSAQQVFNSPAIPARPRSRKGVVIFFLCLGMFVLIVIGLVSGGTTNSTPSEEASSSTQPVAPIDPQPLASTANSTQSGDVSSSTQPAAPINPPPLAVTARQLGQDYEQNEIAADAIYKGKRLAVTGSVVSINKDFMDDPYLILASTNIFLGVHADLKPEEASTAASLTRGSTISLVCTGGGMVVGSPILRDCIFN